MTAMHAGVDAAAVTLEGLAALEAGTPVFWNDLVAEHETTWSPTRNEAPADYCVLADDANPPLMHVTDLDARGAFAVDPFPGPFRASTVAEIIDAIANRGAPVCRFATGMELSNAGGDEYGWPVVPCVFIWTGPVTDAAAIPAHGMRPDVRDGRVQFRGLLSRRVNAAPDDGIDPWERLRLQQLPGPGEWVLQSGPKVRELVHEHTHDVRTLEDVFEWALGWLHVTYGVPEPVAPTGFTVSAFGPDGPLTVRLW